MNTVSATTPAEATEAKIDPVLAQLYDAQINFHARSRSAGDAIERAYGALNVLGGQSSRVVLDELSMAVDMAKSAALIAMQMRDEFQRRQNHAEMVEAVKEWLDEQYPGTLTTPYEMQAGLAAFLQSMHHDLMERADEQMGDREP